MQCEEQLMLEGSSPPSITGSMEWKGFEQMRKRMGKPLTDRAKQMALTRLNMLAPHDLDKQKNILDQSTFCCWLGLYPLPQEKAPTVMAPYDLADLERMINRGMDTRRQADE